MNGAYCFCDRSATCVTNSSTVNVSLCSCSCCYSHRHSSILFVLCVAKVIQTCTSRSWNIASTCVLPITLSLSLSLVYLISSQVMLLLLLRISRLSLSPRVSVSSDKTSFWLTINKQLQNVMEKNKNTNNSIQTQLELYIDGRVRSLLSRGFTHGYTSVSGFVFQSVWQHKFNYSFFFSTCFCTDFCLLRFFEKRREGSKRSE